MEEMLKELSIIFISEPLLIYVVIATVFLLQSFIFYKKKKNLYTFTDEIIETFQSIYEVSEESILILSHKNNSILYANKSMRNLLKLEKDFKFSTFDMPEIKVKKEWQSLEEFLKKIKNNSTRINAFPHSTLRLANSKEKIPVNIYLSNSFVEAKHKKACTIVTINDLRKQREKELLGLQHKLTKLPNQTRAISDLNALYAKVHLGEHKIALIMMDLDNFSNLRSIVGYEQSNVILIKLAQYLEELSKEMSFFVYHTVHNNFLLVINNVDSLTDIQSIVNQIQDELVSFYQMGNSRLYLTVSVGISIFPDNSKTLNLLDNSYKALAQAQKNGFGRVEIFKSHEMEHGYDELKLYNDMHEALEKNQFEVYYQPIVQSSNRQVVAAEALIRWNHPEHGMVAPFVFIPIMEKTGLIVDLGKYVLSEVLKQQKRWERFEFKSIEVSINLSMLELETGKFVEHVIQELEKYEVIASLIKFEITEGIAMISEEQTDKQLKELRALGMGISLDDFGTGYTSFSYLKRIPATTLKIDRSLIIDIVKSEEDQRIVKAIIELGHNLGMKIVTEGIEDEKSFNKLAEFGSDYIQGYYFSKPLPVFEFQKLLRR